MIRSNRLRFLLCPAVAVLPTVAVLPLAAQAALGGGQDSISADQAALHAQRSLTQNTGFEVHELRLASGTVVHEFVAANGTVFAVNWRGQEQPDLRQILGATFTLYQELAQQHHVARSRHVVVNSPQLVFENHGTMRNRAGIAYVPNALPAGVTPADLQP